MSIFELLEIIFFCRTEKLGLIMDTYGRSIISVVFESFFLEKIGFFGIPELEGPIFGHS